MIFDSHAHYDDEAFDDDRDTVFKELLHKNIGCVLNAGSNIEASKKSVELSKSYDFIYSAVGIHPQDADEYNDYSKSILIDLCKFEKVVAIGEIGLDYYYENHSKAIMINAFNEQIKLALELNLPIIVHDREAHKDTYDIIKKYSASGLRGIIHCYSGSLEMALMYIELGFYIGFTGVITFKNAKKTIEVLKGIPMDRILIETDCPYLSPVPNRGKRNDSSNLKYVVERASMELGMSVSDFENLTYSNAKKIYNI